MLKKVVRLSSIQMTWDQKQNQIMSKNWRLDFTNLLLFATTARAQSKGAVSRLYMNPGATLHKHVKDFFVLPRFVESSNIDIPLVVKLLWTDDTKAQKICLSWWSCSLNPARFRQSAWWLASFVVNKLLSVLNTATAAVYAAAPSTVDLGARGAQQLQPCSCWTTKKCIIPRHQDGSTVRSARQLVSFSMERFLSETLLCNRKVGVWMYQTMPAPLRQNVPKHAVPSTLSTRDSASMTSTCFKGQDIPHLWPTLARPATVKELARAATSGSFSWSWDMWPWRTSECQCIAGQEPSEVCEIGGGRSTFLARRACLWGGNATGWSVTSLALLWTGVWLVPAAWKEWWRSNDGNLRSCDWLPMKAREDWVEYKRRTSGEMRANWRKMKITDDGARNTEKVWKRWRPRHGAFTLATFLSWRRYDRFWNGGRRPGWGTQVPWSFLFFLVFNVGSVVAPAWPTTTCSSAAPEQRTDSSLNKQGKRALLKQNHFSTSFPQILQKNSNALLALLLISHHNPFLTIAALPRWERSPKKCCISGRRDRKSEDPRSTRTLSPDRRATLHISSSCKKACRIGLHAKCAKEHNMNFSTSCSSFSSEEDSPSSVYLQNGNTRGAFTTEACSRGDDVPVQEGRSDDCHLEDDETAYETLTEKDHKRTEQETKRILSLWFSMLQEEAGWSRWRSGPTAKRWLAGSMEKQRNGRQEEQSGMFKDNCENRAVNLKRREDDCEHEKEADAWRKYGKIERTSCGRRCNKKLWVLGWQLSQEWVWRRHVG